MSLDAHLAMPEWALINAVRYALPRHTYVTADTAELVRALWPRLSKHARAILLRDLREHVEDVTRDTAERGPRGTLLEIDDRVWTALLTQLEAEPGTRIIPLEPDDGGSNA